MCFVAWCIVVFGMGEHVRHTGHIGCMHHARTPERSQHTFEYVIALHFQACIVAITCGSCCEKGTRCAILHGYTCYCLK